MWKMEVHVYGMEEGHDERQVIGIHRALAAQTSFIVGIQDAAHIAFYRVYEQHEAHLKHTNYRHSL